MAGTKIVNQQNYVSIRNLHDIHTYMPIRSLYPEKRTAQKGFPNLGQKKIKRYNIFGFPRTMDTGQPNLFTWRLF